NVPLLRKDADELIKVIVDEKIKIVFTSAGHPGKYIDLLKKNSIIVVHIVPSLKFALKAESVGCDAVVAEGVEAGGHNGLDEIATFSLIPQIVDELKTPVIAAGGISDGRGILAAMSLGAEGVQIGTRFAVTQESSAHINYKKAIVGAKDKDTHLILKKLGMARVVKNNFSKEVIKRELNCESLDELKEFVNTKRERKGIFEGDLEEGMIEASQSSGLINDIPTVAKLMERFTSEYNSRKACL
ncbi:MAG: nitronate monooxygenase, partial [Ignavibacteriae bacterium]|nr:nitronate monooxygenase [Ignavibacteriota bacterium]